VEKGYGTGSDFEFRSQTGWTNNLTDGPDIANGESPAVHVAEPVKLLDGVVRDANGPGRHEKGGTPKQMRVGKDEFPSTE
jgi:hypothetical protein